jgi:circadian clock protein KaiB
MCAPPWIKVRRALHESARHRAGGGLSLCLFVAGDSPDCVVAIANLEALFPAAHRSHVQIEIVDVQRDPARAADDRIIVTPTLLKVAPAPQYRILGSLRNRDALIQLLDIEAPQAERTSETRSRPSRTSRAK